MIIFYKNETAVSIPDMRKRVLSEYDDKIKLFQRFVTCLTKEDLIFLENSDHCISFEYILEVLCRQRRMIEKGLCESAMVNMYMRYMKDFAIWDKKRGVFIEDERFSNIFSVKDDLFEEAMILNDYESTINFLNNPKNEVDFCVDPLLAIETIAKFWELNPKGLIVIVSDEDSDEI